MRKMFLSLALLATLLGSGRPALAQSSSPPSDLMTVLPSSEEQGTRKIEKTVQGPLIVQTAMGAQWSNTANAIVPVQVKLSNPGNMPVHVESVVAEFKKGARPTDVTVFEDRKGGFSIAPGQSRTVSLSYDNPQSYSQISVDVAVSYHSAAGREYADRVFLKGDQGTSYFNHLNQFGRTSLLTPAGIANYPITTGPLYPWPSEYDMQMQPPNRDIINIGF